MDTKEFTLIKHKVKENIIRKRLRAALKEASNPCSKTGKPTFTSKPMLSISRKYGSDYRYPRLKVALIIWGKRILVDCHADKSARNDRNALDCHDLQSKLAMTIKRH